MRRQDREDSRHVRSSRLIRGGMEGEVPGDEGAQRELVYDDGAEKALAAAKAHGWTVVSVKEDFRTVF